jgi:urease accessory protein
VVAPAEKIHRRAGRASLEVQLVSGESTVTSSYATNPLKLLAPRARGQSVWAYTSNFGGGLVAGDQTSLNLRIGAGTRCFLGTQASTKIYRNPAALPSGHETHIQLDAGSLLVFTPDPVQAFAGSSYTQRQELHLAPDASLVLLDWLTSGRAARGERWEFSRFRSRNDVFVDARRVFLDSVLLSPEDGELSSTHRLGRFNCLAMLLLIGPQLQSVSTSLLESLKGDPVIRRPELVFSASPVADGAVLRIAGTRVEAVGRMIHCTLQPATNLLGDDPWARKW